MIGVWGVSTLPRSLFPGLSAMPLHVSQTPARPSTAFLDSSRATAPCHSSFAVPNPILKRVYLSERIHALPILQPLCFNGLPSNGRGVLPWRSYFPAATRADGEASRAPASSLRYFLT